MCRACRPRQQHESPSNPGHTDGHRAADELSVMGARREYAILTDVA